MDTASLSLFRPLISPKPPTNPTCYPIGSTTLRLQKNPVTVRFASKRDGYGWDYGGGLADENMLVLRKRMEELRVAERPDRDPTEEWMEWERSYYESRYRSDVCQAVGLIQLFAINMRPGVALGLLGLVLSSVPVSVVLMGFQLGLDLNFLGN